MQGWLCRQHRGDVCCTGMSGFIPSPCPQPPSLCAIAQVATQRGWNLEAAQLNASKRKLLGFSQVVGQPSSPCGCTQVTPGTPSRGEQQSGTGTSAGAASCSWLSSQCQSRPAAQLCLQALPRTRLA